MALEFNDSNFGEYLENGKLLVVDFWAEWCGPCRTLGPLINDLHDQYDGDGRVSIGKVDVDKNSELSTKYGIRSIPTVLFIKDGEIVEKQVGVSSKEKYEQVIEAHI